MTALLAAAPEGGRIFGLDAQTFYTVVIILFNACILCGALTFILYKPVQRYMHKRADGIRAQLAVAENAIAKADEMKALYEAKLAEIDQERGAVLAAANEQAAARSRVLLDEARVEIAAMKQRAALALQTERERVDEEIRLNIIEVATVMAGKLVANAIDEDAHTRLFDETIAELEDTQ